MNAGELASCELAQQGLSFTLAVPKVIPLGYRLVDVEAIPGLACWAALHFQGRRRAGFKLVQRVAGTSLCEELESTGIVGQPVEHRGVSLVFVAGAYVIGEPVDGWHWHKTRHRVLWQCGNTICEIEYLAAGPPSDAQVLEIAVGAQLSQGETPEREGALMR